MTTDERITRLERAVAQLFRGVDWSRQRGGRGDGALREICGEQDAATGAEARERRERALEAELADLRAA